MFHSIDLLCLIKSQGHAICHSIVVYAFIKHVHVVYVFYYVLGVKIFVKTKYK